MSRKTAFHDPAIRPVAAWSGPNQGFYAAFRQWLKDTGYGPSAVSLYCVSARLTLGLLDAPYWMLDPDHDLDDVREYIHSHYANSGTRQTYLKGLARLEAYLRLRCRKPKAEPKAPWPTYIGLLPERIGALVRAYFEHRQRQLPPDRRREMTRDLPSRLTRPLRWLARQDRLKAMPDVTPQAWYAYVDARLTEGLKPVSLNYELCELQAWLRWLEAEGEPICSRLLKVEPLRQGPRVPKDVPPEQLQKLLDAVQAAATASHAQVRRCGLMDRAWMLLMLHSGLRTGEVRRLKQSDIDWERSRVRIEQSKGLKDRLVPLSEPTIAALKAYLAVRGPAEALPAELFIYRHEPLSLSYCGQRLRKYYAKRSGVKTTPHALRHSCATLLLNAGAPLLAVREIMGHFHVDTTLEYARLYDGTVAADYYRAMLAVERSLKLAENKADSVLGYGEMIALLDSLRRGTLNEQQAETISVLRATLVALAEKGEAGATAEGDSSKMPRNPL